MHKHKSLVALEKPSLEEAEALLRRAFSEHKSLIIVGNCWVDYKGRASSRLEAGERIILVKESQA